jgi:L-ribulose-5-phosphate 4-epimerase
MMLELLRKEVCEVNKALLKNNLVTMHSGNASGRDFESNLVVIKPSGVDYDSLQPEDLTIVDLDGNIIEGKLKPSVDTPHHIFLYRNKPEWGGIIHTHSNYATSFAAVGKSIPVCLTAIADEFGDDIICTEYVSNEGNKIGETILKNLGEGPAILLGNHGVFTFGESPKSALKAAVMVEDVAKTVHLSFLLGNPKKLMKNEIMKWWNRYHSSYGQE